MEEHEETDRLRESHQDYNKISKSLDPLISTFTTFHSEEQLMSMVQTLLFVAMRYLIIQVAF